jgi:stress response protein YsnF
VPAHEQSVTSAQPVEETHEVILHSERVLFTTQVVPVERVRMVKRVITTGQTVTEPIRSERIDLEQMAEQQIEAARPSRNWQQPEGDTSWD